jgi:hypothetical protein
MMRNQVSKIVERVWSAKLTRRELEAIGMTIGDRKWHRLFGKCDHQANYFPCDKCCHRHFAVPMGSGKFHCVDETGECEIVYEISTDDLALYALKKQSFLNDLQRCAFELKLEKIEEIVPDICWKIGTFLGELGVYFVHKSSQLDMESAISRAMIAIQGEGKSIKQFVFLILREQLLSNETILTVEARKGYIVCLEKLLSLDGGGLLRSEQPLQVLLRKVVQFCNGNERESIFSTSVAAEMEVDSKWKSLYPKSHAPLPYAILLAVDKDGMSIKKFCKKNKIGMTKVYEKLKFARKITKDTMRKHKSVRNYPKSAIETEREATDEGEHIF